MKEPMKLCSQFSNSACFYFQYRADVNVLRFSQLNYCSYIKCNLLIKTLSTGQVEQFELQQAGMIQRLWSGLVPSSLRRDMLAADAVVSLVIHPFGKHMCVFALCRDLKLRIWSCQVRYQRVCTKSLIQLKYTKKIKNVFQKQGGHIQCKIFLLMNSFYFGYGFFLYLYLC